MREFMNVNTERFRRETDEDNSALNRGGNVASSHLS